MEDLKEQLDRIEQISLLGVKNVLSFDDVLLLPGFSRSYLYRLTCERKIPHSKPTGKSIFFDRKEVEQWLLSNKVNQN